MKTSDLKVDAAFYRPRSGLEVDLLLTTPHGVWGLEAKAAARLGRSDWRGLRAVGEALGARWRGGLVVYTGETLEQLGPKLWAGPLGRLLA